MSKRIRTMDDTINDMYKIQAADAKANFQIGDRVSVKMENNLPGTIDRIEDWNGGKMYTVNFDGPGRWAYRVFDLKRI